MKILAVESADQACSVAIWQNGEALQRHELAPRQQTLKMLPWVEQLLAEAGLTLTQLDAIAFGRGPGAFTGVRVATSVAQGLAFSANLPVAGISTLAALALDVSQLAMHLDHFLPVLDARMGEVYLGAYQRDDDALVSPLIADGVFAPTALPAVAGASDIRWAAGGSGLAYEPQLAQAYRLDACHLAMSPQAASVAKLAVRAVAQGLAVAAEQAAPVYLRDQVVQGAVR